DVLLGQRGGQLGKSAIQNGGAQVFGDVNERIQIVDGEQGAGQHLFGHSQVAHISAGEAAAGVTAAGLVNGAGVAGVLRILEVKAPAGAQEGGVGAAQPCGQHAIEDVYAALDALHQILGRAYAHEIARLVGG